MKVRYINHPNYPIEIVSSMHKVKIHKFDLQDDDSWNEFIDQLNFFREQYINGSFEQLKKNIKESKKNT